MPPLLVVHRSAAYRAAAFAAAQATLTPEELEAQKEENRTPSNSAIAHTYACALETAKRWFHELMEDQRPDVDVDSTYFKLGAPAPDLVLLKEYARYLARSRTGLLAPKLQVRTLQHYLEMLIIAMKRDCHFPEKLLDLGRECYRFIGTVLKEQEGLSTSENVKGVAHSDDLTYVLFKLYNPAYLATFANMRQVLNLTLYMLLLVDCTERGCGIARHHKRPEHMCLRWGDVEFYTFSIRDGGETYIDIRANVRIRWGKNQSKDDSSGKIVPFTGLLPTSLAIQDTLHFESRKAKQQQAEELQSSHECGKRQFTEGWMGSIVSRWNLFRRLKYFHKSVAWGDFAGSSIAIGISLNRSSTAPQRISDAGYVLEHEDVVALTRQHQGLQDRILENHPSLLATSRTNKPLWTEYKQVTTNRSVTIKSLVNQVYKQEYAQHLENLSARPEPTCEPAETDMRFDELTNSHSGDTQYTPGPYPSETIHADGSQVGEDSGQSSVEQSGAAAEEDSMSLIDPRLMSEAQADQDEMLNDIMEDETPSEIAQDRQAASATMDAVQNDKSTTRLHGLPRDLIGSRINRVLAPRRGLSSYHDLRIELTSLQGNEAAMFQAMARWFSVTHGIDDFPPGEEPEPGIFNCRFCGLDLATATVHKTHHHTRSCALKDAQQRAKNLREKASPLDRPCNFQRFGTGDQAKQFVDSGQTFSTSKEMGDHMYNHVKHMGKKNASGEKVPTCFFGDCPTNPEGGRLARDGPDVASREERYWHVWTHHRIWKIKTVETTYYEYCGTWLLAPYEWQAHANMHLEDAVRIVRNCGYAGYTTGRTTVPRICPFHLHDETAPTYERVYTYTRDGWLMHLRGHLEEQSGSLRNCPCFPSMCTEARELDGIQMEEHLRVVHGVQTDYKVKKRRAPLKDISETAGSSSDASKKAKA